jgi:hypothetical protein
MRVRAYMQIGFRQKDAAHVACAVCDGGDYFITVEK